MRIGHGYDAHRFEAGRPLVLGGVTIPHDKGLAAHSDGDVLIHAICDALLGAACLGDLGQHFPDSSDDFKNIDSRILLRDIMQKLHQKKFQASSVDVTVIAQKPRLMAFIGAMKSNIASDLELDADRVSIKATTTEGMGFEGRGEGISAHAVVLLQE